MRPPGRHRRDPLYAQIEEAGTRRISADTTRIDEPDREEIEWSEDTMAHKFIPDRRSYTVSVGTRRKLWNMFAEFCNSEATPLSKMLARAICVYGPFLDWAALNDKEVVMIDDDPGD